MEYTSFKVQEEFGQMESLQWICGAILISVLMGNVFRYFSFRVMENFRIHTLLNLRNSLFNHVLDMDLAYFTAQRKGNIISKIASDVQIVQYSVTSTLQVLFKEPLQLIAYLIILFSISIKLTLFAILVIPVSAWAIAMIVCKSKAQAKESQERFGMMKRIELRSETEDEFNNVHSQSSQFSPNLYQVNILIKSIVTNCQLKLIWLLENLRMFVRIYLGVCNLADTLKEKMFEA